MAVRREKSAAMPPEPGPDLFPVGLRQLQTLERGAGEELKTSFGVVGRQCFQARFYLEQKHQPVRPALEAVFADEAGQVQIFGAQRQAGFLVRLAAGAGVGRFAAVHFQFPATGTPQTAVRLLRAFEQKHLIALVEAIQQRGDFVGQNHQTEFQISSAECRGRNGCKETLYLCDRLNRWSAPVSGAARTKQKTRRSQGKHSWVFNLLRMGQPRSRDSVQLWRRRWWDC